MSDYLQKIENFNKAVIKLEEGIGKFDKTDDLHRDGLIQRFKFTFELAWKTLKNIFEYEGLHGLNSPKTVLREAYSADMIQDEEMWLLMLIMGMVDDDVVFGYMILCCIFFHPLIQTSVVEQ